MRNDAYSYLFNGQYSCFHVLNANKYFFPVPFKCRTFSLSCAFRACSLRSSTVIGFVKYKVVFPSKTTKFIVGRAPEVLFNF